MSADLLRRAAAKLREHAEAATPGPWKKDSGEIYGPYGVWIGETLRVDDPNGTEADSDYIALLHPPVALALADLLETAAGYAEVKPHYGDWPLLNWATAVARAILREPEETS
jgi:hypothetical protein